ncbi:hypothetical protein [Flavobacterium sp.]|uniref:hypothetical protein n=1 Tax=Flavobacterium sp. TaxID=239 RepID=UPI0037BE6249
MKKIKPILLVSFFLCFGFLYSQKQNNQWRFGTGQGINFNTNPPSIFNGVPISTYEGSASIADKTTGALLFYTDGVTVWNTNNQVMPNGTGLLGGSTYLSSITAAVIIPKPSSANLFYIVTVQENETLSGGVFYSLVDMNLNGGLGDIVSGQKNIPLYQNTFEKLEVVPASDGLSYWLVTHKDNQFISFQITNSGVQTTPVISTVGSFAGYGSGHLKINKQFNKIVLGFVLNSNFTLTNVELFDFNNLTGEVSNPVMWNFIYGGQVYGLEFSPNGKFLYAANVDKIIQYDLTQTTAQGIQNSAFELSSFAPHGSLQLGIDNKIYVNSANFGLGIINCPNKQGNACNFNPNLFNGGQGLGLPKWVYYPDDPPYPVNNSILYTGTCLGTPTTFTLQSTVGINSLSWNFDDPNSGIDNTSTLLNPTHTFTSTGTYNVSVIDQCDTIATIIVTINSSTPPTFAFGTTLSICSGDTVPVLPTTSLNGIAGTWSPATVSNTTSGTYTFTPDAGQCATTTTFAVTITPQTTPTFSFGTSLSICSGGIVPTLPNTSINSITGTWTPAIVDNSNNGTYTFTPDAGQCATITTFVVTITPQTIPTFSFGTSLSICSGGAVPTLPNTSSNSVTGTWSPSSVSNTASGTYTFTPNAGQCVTSTPVQITITVNPSVTPAFDPIPAFCAGNTAPVLPSTSLNGIVGTWSPATVSNTTSGTYTFTPNAGQCGTITTISITVNPLVTPTFNAVPAFCAGTTAPELPTTSLNGIVGTWSPATVSNTTSGTYTFTPNAGQCVTSTPVQIIITVNPSVTPAFDPIPAFCAGTTAPVLPTTSLNGIVGTWSPATVSNTTSGTYTFTPNAGQCGAITTISITVNPLVTPTFNTIPAFCAGTTAPVLPTTSLNGIVGTWSPATVSNTTSGTYTFTPTAGQCASTQTIVTTINPSSLTDFQWIVSDRFQVIRPSLLFQIALVIIYTNWILVLHKRPMFFIM